MHSRQLPASEEEKALLAGNGEKHFVKLEVHFGVRILTRNPQLTILGEDSVRVHEALEALERMRETLRAGNQLSDFYVDELLRPPAQGDEGFQPHLEKPILIDRFGHPVQPKTKGQSRFIQVIKKNDLVFAGGPAGTGKTFLAVAMAVQALEKKMVERVILCRPAVESGESLGFLPGEVNEKIAPYMRPLHDSLSTMLSTDRLREYWDGNSIEIAPLAYMRGRTLSASFIILDEAQNSTVSQMKMFLTRIGQNSKVILTGDESQVDLPGSARSGFAHARKILSGIEGIGQIELGLEDIVRHRLVREIIKAYEKDGVRA